MKQAPLRLHAIAPYDRSAKVRWLLTELDLPFEERWLSREKREFEHAEYLRINPMGRVPALEIGERPMFESSAIVATLADLHLERGLAPALDAPERAEYQQWMYFAVATLDPMQGRAMIIEDIPAGDLQKTKESGMQADLADAMQALERTLSRDEYLVGNHFTAADICVSYHVNWLRLWPELDAMIAPMRGVIAHLERMKARPAAVRARAFSYQES